LLWVLLLVRRVGKNSASPSVDEATIGEAASVRKRVVTNARVSASDRSSAARAVTLRANGPRPIRLRCGEPPYPDTHPAIAMRAGDLDIAYPVT